MVRQYFGTDGIRGRVNQKPMTAETALRLAIAAARTFAPDGNGTVIIGRDTRRSGDMIEAALVAGLTSMGLTPCLAGIVPTPAVAMTTRLTGARFGLMVSASHNKYADNGIKLFSPEGLKFDDATEETLEAAMAGAFEGAYVAPEAIASPQRMAGVGDDYVRTCLATMGTADRIKGMKVVIDCAHGAGFDVALEALQQCGADVTVIGAAPDGININAGCGSTDTTALKAAVLARKADVGLALDGDADRVIVVDETGAEIDGDQVMALIARELHESGRLKGGGMVSTVMSNMGLDRYLRSCGLTLARTRVGDRYVGEHMRAHGFNFGGEPSGHIILSDVSTTGDGLLAGLHVLSVLAGSGQKMSELGHVFEPAPQELVNIRYSGANPMENAAVLEAITAAEAMMGEDGRMVVRKSGTEPLIRVMAEALEAGLMRRALEHVVAAVKAAS
ncbi:phosphoglucosamine mutase [Hyphomonas johnsonii]|uniref:Phosphoglucosamine mutase n=1 Tax=Hyphomonas johnsonii MHS-2 TaxID=1280950 RepID=A0A059FHL2_9PROT|nr:phosphoglucosamine mutase [Hyphomonas johnsonii]KCZ90087.1 phosphoglucosamine mutase [Hyphomonas johnsonii MHS-2]